MAKKTGLRKKMRVDRGGACVNVARRRPLQEIRRKPTPFMGGMKAPQLCRFSATYWAEPYRSLRLSDGSLRTRCCRLGREVLPGKHRTIGRTGRRRPGRPRGAKTQHSPDPRGARRETSPSVRRAGHARTSFGSPIGTLREIMSGSPCESSDRRTENPRCFSTGSVNWLWTGVNQAEKDHPRC